MLGCLISFYFLSDKKKFGVKNNINCTRDLTMRLAIFHSSSLDSMFCAYDVCTRLFYDAKGSAISVNDRSYITFNTIHLLHNFYFNVTLLLLLFIISYVARHRTVYFPMAVNLVINFYYFNYTNLHMDPTAMFYLLVNLLLKGL